MGESLVMIVEDNPDDAELALRAIKKNGSRCGVVLFNDGSDAVDYLLGRNRYSKNEVVIPSVILLDLKMPLLGGIEFIKQIRSMEKIKYIPIVILTTSQEESDIFESYANGANSYIRKPVDFNAFTSLMRVVLEYWIDLNINSHRSEGYHG
jgi:two-component system, response regulator